MKPVDILKNTGYIYAVRCVNRLIYSAYEDPERYMNTQCAEEGMNYEKTDFDSLMWHADADDACSMRKDRD